jgi:hypothetical protein
MIRGLVFAALAIVVLGGSESHADREKPEQPKKGLPTTAPTPVFDLRKLMSQKVFQSAGLAKLDADELETLNQWLTDFATQVLTEKQSRAGCQTPIETSIDGEFEGWSGDTVFKLMNGQIWKQSSYNYTYSYKYSPKVLIYKSGGLCKFKVDGVDGEISVDRLK